MKSGKPPLTVERVRALLDYTPDNGHLLWRVAPSRGIKVGAHAGCKHWSGYRRISIGGRMYMAHRLAWLHTYGVWPTDQLDHINGARDDNRISNLRECTQAENHQNYGLRDRNSSGFPGVSWHKGNKKWRAHIRVAGKLMHLGYFDNPLDAFAAYSTAKTVFHTFQPVVRVTPSGTPD